MKSFVIIMKCILWLLLYHVMEKRDGMKLSEVTYILQSTHKSAEFCKLVIQLLITLKN